MNEVIVKVIGRQTDAAGEENALEVVSIGRHYYKNGINYVLYDERDEESVITSVLLKIADDKMTIVRRGEIKHEQSFIKNKRCQGKYVTPYGSLPMAVVTKDLMISFGAVSGDVNVKYDLEVGGEWVSANELSICICADKHNCHLN